MFVGSILRGCLPSWESVGMEDKWRICTYDYLTSESSQKSWSTKEKEIPSVGEAPKLHKCSRCKEIDHNRLTCTNPISYIEKSSIQD